MCRSVDCSTCQGKTWTGCGQHISSAMSGYNKDEWCSCVDKDGNRGEFPPKSGDVGSPVMNIVLALLVGFLLLKFFK